MCQHEDQKCSLLKTLNAIIRITKLGLLSFSGTKHLKRSEIELPLILIAKQSTKARPLDLITIYKNTCASLTNVAEFTNITLGPIHLKNVYTYQDGGLGEEKVL